VADSSIYFLETFFPTQSQEHIKHNETSFLLYMYNIVRGGFLRHYLNSNTVYDINTINTTFVRVHNNTHKTRFDSACIHWTIKDDIQSSYHYKTVRFRLFSNLQPKTIFDRHINMSWFPGSIPGNQNSTQLLCFFSPLSSRKLRIVKHRRSSRNIR
jgi:hypothetical protein